MLTVDQILQPCHVPRPLFAGTCTGPYRGSLSSETDNESHARSMRPSPTTHPAAIPSAVIPHTVERPCPWGPCGAPHWTNDMVSREARTLSSVWGGGGRRQPLSPARPLAARRALASHFKIRQPRPVSSSATSPGKTPYCLRATPGLASNYGKTTASANHCCTMSIALGGGLDRKTTARLFTGREQQT